MNIQKYLEIACQGAISRSHELRLAPEMIETEIYLWNEYSKFRNEELFLTSPVASSIEVLLFSTKVF